MTRQDILDELGQMLEAGAPLTGREKLKELEGWDSLAAVSFMALADETYGIAIAPRDLAACHSVDDLIALLGIEASSPQ